MKNISEMSHDEAATLLRFLEQMDSKQQVVMLDLCRRAAKTAPEKFRGAWAQRLKVYEEGRTVRHKITTGEDFDPGLVAQVEEAFKETS